MSYQLGNKIKKLRIHHNISKEEIAKYLELTIKKYDDIEAGKVNMSFIVIKAVADYMGIETSEITSAEEEKKYLATLFRENYEGEAVEDVISSVEKVNEILQIFNAHETLYNQMRSKTEFESIGEVIQSLRENMGMTREQLENKVGLAKHEIIKIEKGQRALALEEAISISEVLSVSVDELYGYIKDNGVEDTFFMKAFRDKQMNEKDLLEIKKVDLLMDALQTQQEIFNKEETI